MLLSIKTKLKLSKTQEIIMSKHAGIARFTYNWGLATWNSLFKDGLKPNKYILKKFFNNHVKPEFEWIKEKGICQKITQYAFDNLGDAFSRFFTGIGSYPNFKKKGHHDSFTIDASGKPIPVGGKSIKLPTIGCVKTYEGLPYTTCKSITISRTADSWFIAFTYQQEHEPTTKQQGVVGVDLDVKELATLSTGVVFPNPKHYKTNLEKLGRLSRKFSRKVKGYNNRHKAKTQLAKHHARVANLRKNTLHQITLRVRHFAIVTEAAKTASGLTTFLCKNHAKIVVEDLNVSGMLANHKLAQVIADCGFHEFKRQLEYKAKKFGSEIIIADRWFPSSKTCSNCRHIQDMPLKERTYNCKSCGHSMTCVYSVAY
ncbi:RNA-guided endonuclease InsQ/TnpB family protein [Brasilonema octagenarum]|uniref:Transposase n=1 Tax=Brasilonema octagenarum UFV-OR1 TaxID=417115 RepID=A0ABX1M5V3_9CYAN|nr:RNA-guided endonuclease TnpB family protein [Brasilonema octagenarum]NMF63923.1 transposase [Brasilonema octagenarum UFV-OR1]